MACRVKEDEKNERIIRALLKQPANKRCINCNNLGPQYVCTNFWTFVCTNCSGAHREFTHRVKSVSMAKFTAQEVNALQEGGNERAREIFLKEWDPQRNSYPDSSNADKLRNFIKHVYVERRYTGERSADRPPRAKDDKEDYGESRRSDIYRGGSRSPPYNESYSESRSYSGRSDDRNSRYSYGERSPGFDQNDYKKSPRYFEVVDDRYRDDRSENKVPVQRFEERRSSEPRKLESGSPNHQKEVGGSSPPVVRPIREILGDGAPQLRVGDLPKPNGGRAIDPPKPNGTRVVDPLPQTQRTSSARSIGSAEGTSEQAKVANTISLIDFSADPEPTVAAPPPPQTVPTPPPPPQTVPTPPQQPVNAPLPQPVPQQGNSPSVSGGNWASFDAFGQQQAPRSAGTVNPLDSALAQLSFSESPSSANASNLPASVGFTPKANDGGPLAMVNQSHSSLFDVSVGVPSNQASPEMTIQGSVLCAPSGGLTSQVPKNSEMTIGTQASSSSTESKSSGRKELPADFFTSLYLSAAPTMPGWHRPQFGMGYAMQYPPGMAMQAFPQSAYPQPAYPRPVYTQPAYTQPAKASNPFDLEPAPIQAPMFPSGPQGASASTTPSALPHSSSFGVPTPQCGLAQPPQQLYPPATPPNQYLMQQVPNNIPEQLPHNMVPIQQGGLGSINIGFDQQPAAGYSQSNTPPYGSVGGNPFG